MYALIKEGDLIDKLNTKLSLNLVQPLFHILTFNGGYIAAVGAVLDYRTYATGHLNQARGWKR